MTKCMPPMNRLPLNSIPTTCFRIEMAKWPRHTVFLMSEWPRPFRGNPHSSLPPTTYRSPPLLLQHVLFAFLQTLTGELEKTEFRRFADSSFIQKPRGPSKQREEEDGCQQQTGNHCCRKIGKYFWASPPCSHSTNYGSHSERGDRQTSPVICEKTEGRRTHLIARIHFLP